MKFFIDTANLEEIQEANDLGVLDGVTTNPSLCAKIGVRDFEGHIKRSVILLKEMFLRKWFQLLTMK